MAILMKKLRWMIMICMMMALVGIGRVDVKAIDSDSGDGFLYFENDDGTLSISGYYGNEETIVFPSELDGKKVSTICIKQSKSWDRDTVKHVTISEGISKIIVHPSNTFDDGAFWECHNLESVSLPSTLTTIGDNTFTFCNNLNHVILPKNLTEIGVAAFQYCYSLERLEIPDSVVKIGDGAFFLGWLKYVPVYANPGSYAHTYVTENDIPFSCMEHKETVAMPEIPATCAKIGRTAGDLCTVCGTFANGGETIPATGHTVVPDPDIPATCTKPGRTKRSHCSVCSQIISHGEAIPLKAHTVVIDPPIPATCTLPGRSTEGSHCSVCSQIISSGEAIPATGHTIVPDQAIPATCTTPGRTQSSHCSVCSTVTSSGEAIPATGHTIVPDQAIPATCKNDGGTKGRCAVCGEDTGWIHFIPRQKHKIIRNYTPPTCTQYGKTEIYCEFCKEINIDENGNNLGVSQYQSPLGHKYDQGIIDVKSKKKILTCTVCGEITYTGIKNSDIPQKGDILSEAEASYKVIKGGLTGGTVSFTGTRSSKTHIIIPDTVTIDDITYKVTAIVDNALKNNRKVTKVTIGKYVAAIGKRALSGCTKLKAITIGSGVRTIGAEAFQGCKKLKTLTVTSKKLTKVGKNALKGIHPEAKIKVPAKKLKFYQNTFKKKGQKPTVCIIK